MRLDATGCFVMLLVVMTRQKPCILGTTLIQNINVNFNFLCCDRTVCNCHLVLLVASYIANLIVLIWLQHMGVALSIIITIGLFYCK